MSGTCTSCTTKTLPCWAPGNTCAAEFTSVLSKLGAPAPGANNLNMLLALLAWRACGPETPPAIPSRATTRWRRPGNRRRRGGAGPATPWLVPRCCYATLHDGATAIADTLQNGAYPTIVAALRGDWTQCQWQCSAAIRAEPRGLGHRCLVARLVSRHLRDRAPATAAGDRGRPRPARGGRPAGRRPALPPGGGGGLGAPRATRWPRCRRTATAGAVGLPDPVAPPDAGKGGSSGSRGRRIRGRWSSKTASIRASPRRTARRTPPSAWYQLTRWTGTGTWP